MKYKATPWYFQHESGTEVTGTRHVAAHLCGAALSTSSPLRRLLVDVPGHLRFTIFCDCVCLLILMSLFSSTGRVAHLTRNNMATRSDSISSTCGTT